MLKFIKIGKCNITLVLRHRFEKKKKWELYSTFKKWQISIWFKKNKMVSKSNFKNPDKWQDNLVNQYIIGFELFIFKAWVNWDFNGMHLEIKN